MNENKLEVLVADDDRDFLLLIAHVLRQGGCVVKTARDGTEVLEYLADCMLGARSAPDVILSDVRMPGYTGDNILVAVDRAGWNIPVVLMTAYPPKDVPRRSPDESVDMVLRKPIDLSHLPKLIRHVHSAHPS